PIRTITGETRNQCVSMEIRKPSTRVRINERLILLGPDGIEIIFRGRGDCVCWGMVDPKIQAEPVPNLEWIASENIEARALLFIIQTIVKTKLLRYLLRQFVSIDAELVSNLIVPVGRIEKGEAGCQRA